MYEEAYNASKKDATKTYNGDGHDDRSLTNSLVKVNILSCIEKKTIRTSRLQPLGVLVLSTRPHLGFVNWLTPILLIGLETRLTCQLVVM